MVIIGINYHLMTLIDFQGKAMPNRLRHLRYAARNLLIASVVAFAFDKTVCSSGMNTELRYGGVSDVEATALITGTYPSPPP